MKKYIIFILFLGVICLIPKPAAACVGARQLAMGGAFIAIADDASAVYWNPAGLVQLKNIEFTYTRTMNNRDKINYDDFFSFAWCNENQGTAVAWSYIGSGFKYLIDYTEDGSPITFEPKNQRYVISVAKKLWEGFSIGANIRSSRHTYTLSAPGYWPYSESDSNIELDLSVLCKFGDLLTAGVLVQNVNKPKYTIMDESWTMVRNVRPGIALRITDSLRISADYYDLLKEAQLDDRLMLGTEMTLGNFAFRAGTYMGNKTAGVGYAIDDLQIGGRKARLKIDCALLMDDLRDTFMLGATMTL